MRTTSTSVSTPPLRAVRTARGLSLRDVAQKSGLDPGYLSKVERGQKCLSLEALYRISLVLGLGELSRLLKHYVPAAVAAEVESAATGGNDNAPGVEPGASVEKPIPTAK